MSLNKKNWILLLLMAAPLDRIRLMKALFLLWYRSGKSISGYFEFKPYLYGPCSFEVYSILDELTRQGLIVQPPYPIQQWANYYLTERGKAAVKKATQSIDENTREMIGKVAEEVSQLGFYELLRKVYMEAPDFAVNSVIRETI